MGSKLGIDWQALLTPTVMITALRVGLMIALGLPLLALASYLVGRLTRKRFSEQAGMIARKTITYAGFVILFVAAMNELGFQLTGLLGAAGIAGIALGFASQTSVSNIISGLFLISEKPFEVGDLIEVQGKLGLVLSIDLLSVKVRTFDNRFIRIPNESLIRTEVTNITRYPIRRLDIRVSVAYKEDVARVMGLLRDIADKDPHVLDEPEPLILFTNFGDSGLEFLYGVWFLSAEFLAVKNSIMLAIKERFDREGIEIPFPHRTLYAGAATPPMPVRIVGEEARKHPGPSPDVSAGDDTASAPPEEPPANPDLADAPDSR